MAKSKRPPQEQSSEPPQHGWQDLPVPDELKGVEDLSIRVEPGRPAAYAFSLDFPATLTAIVRSEEAGGFSAEVPAFPGCFTEGETLEELRVNLLEAADGWIKACQDLASAELFRETLKGLDER
jgi:predicted RNase H-like HicB family nuclease